MPRRCFSWRSDAVTIRGGRGRGTNCFLIGFEGSSTSHALLISRLYKELETKASQNKQLNTKMSHRSEESSGKKRCKWLANVSPAIRAMRTQTTLSSVSPGSERLSSRNQQMLGCRQKESFSLLVRIMLYGPGSLDTHSVANTSLEHIAIPLLQFPEC